METVVGVVGPRDLVDLVARICEEQPGVRVQRYPYSHEMETPGIVQGNAASVDAWLFTGIIPYTLARGMFTRPVSYVDYTGPTLLQAFVHVLRTGHDITQLSVDTLAAADVRAVLDEAGVPTQGVHALAFRPGMESHALIEFHRKHARPDSVAFTCVSTVYEALRDEITIHRLVPSWDSIRFAIRQLLLVTTNQINEDSQVALGIIETFPGSDRVEQSICQEAAALAGTAVPYGEGQNLIVTTQGRLSAATDKFSSAGFLQRLATQHTEVHAGFGLGHSAAEAETLARRALARAHTHGPVAAVASFRNDVDILLDADGGADHRAEALAHMSAAVVAARVGLSVQTLQHVHDLSANSGREGVTTRDVAARLGIQQRTARRILQRLELAGLAERTGHVSPGTSGRPLTLYRLHL